MSDALEQAALAFDTEISGNSPARGGEAEPKSRPTESMFDSLGDLEVDETSPRRGGGDDEPVEEEIQARRRQAREEVDDEEIDGDEGQDEEVDPDADEQDEDDDAPDDVYEVVVDGERLEVPLREALNGYIRQETFHRRLNQLNEVCTAVVNRSKEVDALRDEYLDLIDKMKVGIDALVPSNINWDEMYAQDPKGARELENKYNGFKGLLKNLDEEKKAELQKRDAEKAEASRLSVARENERIMQNNPSWRDPKVMQRDQAAMLETATRAGYSVDEVAGIVDSRQVSILLKAAKWDKLQGNRPKPVRKGVKPGQKGAGNGNSRTAPRADKGAMKQLSRTGSVEDAAAVFSGIISKSRR